MNLDQLTNPPFGVYGDLKFRGKCPREDLEQITFFNRLRTQHPATWGALALHPRNEGQKRGGQITAVSKEKAEGMTPGSSDIIIPAGRAFVCEMKRRDYTLCSWQPGQVEYLTAARHAGAFACVAFGVDAAWQAFEDWLAGRDPQGQRHD